MVNFNVQYDRSVLGKLAIQITNAPKKIATYVKDVLPAFLVKEIRPLTTEPREPTLPFIWSFNPIKQRQLRNEYFAKLPKGSRGGRYVRTHRLVRSWDVSSRATRGGAEATVSNDAPFLDTVQGPDATQYPSHKDSGWVQYEGVLTVAGDKGVDLITGQWLDILTGDDP